MRALVPHLSTYVECKSNTRVEEAQDLLVMQKNKDILVDAKIDEFHKRENNG